MRALPERGATLAVVSRFEFVTFRGLAACWAGKFSTDAPVFLNVPRVLCVQANFSIFINCLQV